MLKLLLGTDWTKNREEILRRIASDVAQKQGRRILMVPELISHDTERRLCAVAGDTASRYAEVLSFTRLARRVLDTMGGGAVECLDDGGRVVAMASAARQLHSRLKAYASVETKPEFLTELVDAVDEFKRCCITAQDLLAASGQTEGTLAQKLEELSLLLEAYDGLCAQGKRDPRDQMTWLLERLEDSDYGKTHVFYIDGFPDFTRQHLAILEHLIQVSPSVTVSLNCDKPDSHAMAFEKAGATATELIRCAKRAGVTVEIEVISCDETPVASVCRSLFQGQIPAVSSEILRVYCVDSVYEECQAAADRILSLVEAGCRYRDISVVCTDMATYQSPIRMIFQRCGIPVYQSGTEDILQKNVINTVLSALDAALGGLEQKDVLRYLKSVLSPLDIDTCDKVENYVILWGIHGKQWLSRWKNHPDGLGEEWNSGAEKRLEILNTARERAIMPLARLRDGFRDAKNLSQQVMTVYTFLEEIKLASRLRTLADRLEEQGDGRNAQILNQLWDILLTALEQMYDVLGATVWDAEVFTRLFTLLLSQYDVGTIPPVLDAVMVGPVSAMRCQEQKHLLVLGAQEGNLPGYGGSKGVLTDQERVTLRQLGIPLTGGSMEGLQAEFAEIYGVFCGAKKTITVSYPGEQPSFVCRRLIQMAGGESNPSEFLGSVQRDPLESAAYFVQRKDEDDAMKLGVSEQYSHVLRQRDYSLGNIHQENVRGLYGDLLRLSASQVDKQGDCRLAYFLKYGLRARERKEASVDPAEFGTYVHAVLEETGKQVMGLGGFHQVSLEQTLEIAREVGDAYARERFAELDSHRLNYLFQRNNQELEIVVREWWQELHHSEYSPVDFELAFGEGAKMPPIRISGENMQAQLLGFVDRVDAWEHHGRNYFRVVDYKTGKKDFDYCDVFNGIGLQMLLYLFALEQGGEEILGDHPVSAGVQYFPARVPFLPADGRVTDEEAEKIRAKEWKRRGLLLSDEASLKAMEPDMANLCCKILKDGTLTGDLADRQQLNTLRDYIMLILGRMVDEISSGNVEPNPYTRGTSHNACAFCPYKAVCHYLTVEGRRNYKAMSDQRFWEEIGKELTSHG